jgi:thiamine kinase-like enzyme
MLGWSNKLLRIKINCDAIPEECKQLVIREFGDNTKVLNKAKEKAIFRELSRQGTSIHEYGSIGNYRVEKYINAANISQQSMLTEEGVQLFAEAICKYHHNKPLIDLLKSTDGQAPFCSKLLSSWLVVVKENLNNYAMKCTDKALCSMVNEFRCLQSDDVCTALMKALDVCKNGEAVCSHNDIHSGNLMVTGANEMVLIDFEYTALNYRAFDLALYHNEVAFNYAHPTSPFFTYSPSNVLPDQLLMLMCESYVRYAYEHYYTGLNNAADFLVKESAALYSEVRSLVSVALLYWALWGLLVTDWDNINECNLIFAAAKLSLLKKELNII